MEEKKKILLDVQNISVNYGNIRALSNVSLYIGTGEVVALIGANGSGKSTLLDTILGIKNPFKGRIKYLEKDITNRPTDSIVAGGIAIAPEGRAIFPFMSVKDNLLLGTYHIKGDKDKILKRALDYFPKLRERKDQFAGTLSGGEQQMLEIARLMVSEPKLMILDEPSLGLAPIFVETLFEIITELKKAGNTILLSEQNAKLALKYSDRTYVLETGTVILQGHSWEVERDAKVRKAYLGVRD